MTDSCTLNFWIKGLCLLHFHRYYEVAFPKDYIICTSNCNFWVFPFPHPVTSTKYYQYYLLVLIWWMKTGILSFVFLEVEHLNFFSFTCYIIEFCFSYQFVGDFCIVGILTHCLSQYYTVIIAYHSIFSHCGPDILSSLLYISKFVYGVSFGFFLVGLVTQDPEFLFPCYQPMCKGEEHRKQAAVFVSK